MKECLQEKVIRELRNIYKYRKQVFPPSYEQFARQNCKEDFLKLAANPGFQKFIIKLNAFDDKYVEFKRIYHRLLVDLYINSL